MQSPWLFTGQRDTGLGIYDFHARMYDPKIGRFLSPDTIVPGMANPQAWNRYSYTLNNPLRYTDPTGHAVACEVDEDCKEVRRADKLSGTQAAKEALKKYKVGLKEDGWTDSSSIAVLLGVMAVANKLGGTDEFHKVFKNGVNFTWEEGAGTCDGVATSGGGCTDSASQIRFWSMSNDMVKNVVHELGHAFYHAVKDDAGYYPALGTDFSRAALIRNASYGKGEAYVWEQHPVTMNKDNQEIATELFADTFLAWTYDTWNPDNLDAVTNARNAMDRIASSIP